jgi:glycosyltransferase involved in cell wall biosynthesis
MNLPEIRKVLLTEGREVGGLRAFARALAEGFKDIGYSAEIVPPRDILGRWRDLRDPSVLKILSTTAVFMVPFSRRTICVAHGFPRPDAQGWMRTLAILASLKLANWKDGCPLVAVSDYVAVHLRGVYGLRVDGVIRNPVQPMFTEPWEQKEDRRYLTYVGRLLPSKNMHRILPAMRRVLEEDSTMRICIVGDGPQRQELEDLARGDERVEFTGNCDSLEIRTRLRQTKVFVSGNEMEPFGITYLEALSQGCIVAMPACGGGLEIAPKLIGSQIRLLPISFEQQPIVDVLRKAVIGSGETISMVGHRASDVARAYLSLAQKQILV